MKYTLSVEVNIDQWACRWHQFAPALFVQRLYIAPRKDNMQPKTAIKKIFFVEFYCADISYQVVKILTIMMMSNDKVDHDTLMKLRKFTHKLYKSI
jgi:hypothetical protein